MKGVKHFGEERGQLHGTRYSPERSTQKKGLGDRVVGTGLSGGFPGVKASSDLVSAGRCRLADGKDGSKDDHSADRA